MASVLVVHHSDTASRLCGATLTALYVLSRLANKLSQDNHVFYRYTNNGKGNNIIIVKGASEM